MSDSYFNTTPAAVYRFLDREEIAKRRERAFRNQMRRIKKRSLRKFILALKTVMLEIPGPEICIPKKVMQRLKIGRSRYFFLLKKVDKTWPSDPLVGGCVNEAREFFDSSIRRFTIELED